ncbi:hypothetical protein [Serratia sp. DD3]|uniref:hypothetical protein n=1 Tax=Serratia sp. DD3 TaxID=1410619 RepID=UPI0005675A5F|nr:hypothetical protein [Serratia sp. DD3]
MKGQFAEEWKHVESHIAFNLDGGALAAAGDAKSFKFERFPVFGIVSKADANSFGLKRLRASGRISRPVRLYGCRLCGSAVGAWVDAVG